MCVGKHLQPSQLLLIILNLVWFLNWYFSTITIIVIIRNGWHLQCNNKYASFLPLLCLNVTSEYAIDVGETLEDTIEVEPPDMY